MPRRKRRRVEPAASPRMPGPPIFCPAPVAAELYRRVQEAPIVGRYAPTCLWLWNGGYKHGEPPAGGQPCRLVVYACREQVSRMK